MHIIGNIRNIDKELTKHIQLFVACNPNEGILIKLYSSENITTSLNTPSINATDNIIIVLVIKIYIDSRPYFISASFSSL